MTTKQPDRFLRLKAVLEQTGLVESDLRHRMRDGTFPMQTKISERCVAWRQSEIAKWKRQQARRRAAADKPGTD